LDAVSGFSVWIHSFKLNKRIMQQFYIEVREDNPTRRVVNGLVALATGILTLIRPDMLTTIIAAYLIASGLIAFFFRSAMFTGAAAITAGIFIFAFPNLIPYAFAIFLLIMAFGSIMSGGLSFFGIIAFIFALVIISDPNLVKYGIAAFLVFYGVFSIFGWVQRKRLSREEIQEF
jgi:hypothetical protein